MRGRTEFVRMQEAEQLESEAEENSRSAVVPEISAIGKT